VVQSGQWAYPLQPLAHPSALSLVPEGGCLSVCLRTGDSCISSGRLNWRRINDDDWESDCHHSVGPVTANWFLNKGGENCFLVCTSFD